MQTVDMHIHTNWSYDGYLPVDELARASRRRGLTTVAITDHDEVAGALGAERLSRQGRLGVRVIVGEEIATRDGEIIGLFLREAIPPGMSLAETLAAIHDQHGLVYLNHPFGYATRSAVLRFDALERLWERVDIVEVFNGRNRTQRANRQAEALAAQLGTPGGVGTDAHSAWEVGRSFVRVADFDGPRSFLAALRRGERVCRPCPPLYRLWVKARKVLRPQPCRGGLMCREGSG